MGSSFTKLTIRETNRHSRTSSGTMKTNKQTDKQTDAGMVSSLRTPSRLGGREDRQLFQEKETFKLESQRGQNHRECAGRGRMCFFLLQEASEDRGRRPVATAGHRPSRPHGHCATCRFPDQPVRPARVFGAPSLLTWQSMTLERALLPPGCVCRQLPERGASSMHVPRTGERRGASAQPQPSGQAGGGGQPEVTSSL